MATPEHVTHLRAHGAADIWLRAAALAAAALTLTACSGGATASQPAHTTPATLQAPPGLPTDQTDVARVWEQFFDAGTPVALKRQLVQNGATLGAAVSAFASDPATARSTANVTKVTFDGPNTARVSYDVVAFGKTRQAAATGTAVRVGGQWLVSAASLCALVKPAAATPVPGC